MLLMNFPCAKVIAKKVEKPSFVLNNGARTSAAETTGSYYRKKHQMPAVPGM